MADIDVQVKDAQPINVKVAEVVNIYGDVSEGVQSVQAGDNVTVDDADPKNPIVSATVPTVADQTLSIDGQDLTISGDSGNTVTLPAGGGGGGGGGGTHRFSATIPSILPSASGFRTVIFATEGFDSSEAYDPTTGIFTAPAAGVYQFNVAMYVGTDGRRLIRLQKNGSDIIALSDDNSGQVGVLSGSALVSLSLNDYISVNLYTAKSVASGDSLSHFSGYSINI